MHKLGATIFLALGLILTQAISMPAAARGHSHGADAHRGKSQIKHTTKQKVDEPESIFDIIFSDEKAERQKARAKKHKSSHFPSIHWKIPYPWDNYQQRAKQKTRLQRYPKVHWKIEDQDTHLQMLPRTISGDD